MLVSELIERLRELPATARVGIEDGREGGQDLERLTYDQGVVLIAVEWICEDCADADVDDSREAEPPASEDPLTQYELNQLRCDDPECPGEDDELFFHARCHPDAPPWVVYDPERGALKLICSGCDQAVETIAVARGG